MPPSRPRAVIDAHTLGRRATGNETYIRGLVTALSRRADVEPLILVDDGAPIADELTPMARGLPHRHPIPRLVRDLATPGRRWDADLLHVQYVRPPRCDVPCVTTIHDISYEHDATLFERRTALRMRLTIPWSARRSAAVLTGSSFSRRDLLDRYRLDPERVFVTPYSVDDRFRPVPPEAISAVRLRLGLPEAYLLYVGNLQPRKNLPRLLDAYVRLQAAGDAIPLVIVGQRAWLYGDIFDSIRRHRLDGRIHFTGYIADDDLPAVYGGARAFVYPSLFEGFGLPVLEALSCGVPTLTSNTTSLPEVAGDAAILVDPTDVDALAEGLRRLLDDEALREKLRAAGIQQAARFSWARCAELTAGVYRLVAGHSG